MTSEHPIIGDAFRLAIEAAPTGMLMVDREGTIVLVNSHIEQLFGYPRGELIGQPVELLVPPRMRASHPASRQRFFHDPTTRPMGAGRDLYGRHRDGTEIPIEIGLNPLRLDDADFVLSSVVDITERKRAVEQFRLAIEAAPTGMLMVDRAGRIVLVNAQIEGLFGYVREELIGRPVEMLVPERFRHGHPGHRAGFLHDPKARPMGAGQALYGLCKDGSEIRIEIGLNPLHTTEGEFILSSVSDVTERTRAEREREQLLQQHLALNTELRRSLAEREVLLQEVHHRVKNNLQVMSSLINMQVRTLRGGPGSEALEEYQNRMQAIALIHEKLYISKDYARVPFTDYVRSLATSVFAAMSVSPQQVRLELDVDDVVLGVDRAIPCGLVLNELISNALKHAFPNGRSGVVQVTLARADDGRLRLEVADDGIGLPEDVEPSTSGSLGLQLVHTLSEQLDAELVITSDGGSSWSLTFAEA